VYYNYLFGAGNSKYIYTNIIIIMNIYTYMFHEDEGDHKYMRLPKYVQDHLLSTT